MGETSRCFNTCIFEHKRNLKPFNMAKVKKDGWNKKSALIKHCFRYVFFNLKVINFNIDLVKKSL